MADDNSNYSDDISEEYDEISEDNDENPLKGLELDMEKVIDTLYRILTIIRRPMHGAVDSRAAQYVIMDEVGNDVNKMFASYAFQVVIHRYSKAPEILQRRLTDAIVQRKRILLYRHAHQKRLRSGVVPRRSVTNGRTRL